MRRWGAVLAAAGICLFITINLWTDRTGGTAVHVWDLVGSVAIALASVAIGWLLAARLTVDDDRRGLIALVFGVWGLAFGTFQILAAAHLFAALERGWLAAAVWTTLCALTIAGVARRGRPILFVTRVLAITAIFLLTTQILKPAAGTLRSARAATFDRHARADSTPDVYVIVLDKYSSGAWLQHTYAVDHSPFEDALRGLGFVVPRAARANYPHTQISLASFLNWQYVHEDSADSQVAKWETMRQLVADARAWNAFRDRGYRIVTFPTTFPGTRAFRNADLQLRPPNIRPSRLPMTWWSNSPVLVLTALGCSVLPCESEGRVRGPTPYPIEPLHAIDWKLETLASLPDSVGPIFAFVHLLAPHEPYLFNADCSAREPWWPLSDQGEDFEAIGEAYAHQVRCLAPRLLQTVRAILERSKVRPVIILQSDHGHGRISVDPLRGFTLSSDELSADQLGDRLGIFAAYTFPGADTLVRDDISPVNVFPLVLRSLFADGPGQQPDRSFWSSYQAAFSFIELPAEVTRPAGVGALPAIVQIRAAQPPDPAIP